jgi:hypothetical protein
VAADARVNRIQVRQDGPEGVQTFDLCGGHHACPSQGPEFDLVLSGSSSVMTYGDYTLTATAYDDREGVGRASATFSVVPDGNMVVRLLGARRVRLGAEFPAVRDFQVEILVRGARVLDVEMVLDDTST